MGLVLSLIYRIFGASNHKVLIVGLDNAGKSTILYQFVLKEAVHTSPTIGSNVEEMKWKNLHLIMWDLGGQSSLRPSWSTYFSGSDELKKAKILIFANKQDVDGCMSVAEISQNLNLTSIREHPWHIQACCALTGEGLPQGLDWFVSQTGR